MRTFHTLKLFLRNLTMILVVVCFGVRVISFGSRHLNDFSHAHFKTSMSQTHAGISGNKFRSSQMHPLWHHNVDHASPLSSVVTHTTPPAKISFKVEDHKTLAQNQGPSFDLKVPTPPPSEV